MTISTKYDLGKIVYFIEKVVIDENKRWAGAVISCGEVTSISAYRSNVYGDSPYIKYGIHITRRNDEYVTHEDENVIDFAEIVESKLFGSYKEVEAAYHNLIVEHS